MGVVAEVGRRRVEGADLGQRAGAGRSIEMDRHPKFGPDPLAELARQQGSLGQRRGADRHDRHHVGGAPPGMDARVGAEVDGLDRRGNRCENAVEERGARQGQDNPVVVGVEGAVQDVGARPRGGGGEPLDDDRVPALREVWNRLQQGQRQPQAE